MMRSYFNAIPHLYRQFWKEQLVLGIAWGLYGVVVATLIWLGRQEGWW